MGMVNLRTIPPSAPRRRILSKKLVEIQVFCYAFHGKALKILYGVNPVEKLDRYYVLQLRFAKLKK